jgi:antitoxin FitA
LKLSKVNSRQKLNRFDTIMVQNLKFTIMPTISLRDIPEPMYQQIKTLAECERRSVNQQILILLERAIAQPRSPQPEALRRMHLQRAAIEARVGLLPDSADAIAQDRQR